MDMPVDALIGHPDAGGLLYAGTDFGVMVSTDAGGTWGVLGQGLPHVAVYGLAYQPGPGALAAGTFGRSAWALTFRAGGLATVPAELSFTMTAGGPAPAAQAVEITDTEQLGSVVSFTVAGDAPWLDLGSTSGKVAGASALAVKASVAAGQAVGVHTATITLTQQSGAATTIPVTLTVKAAAATTSKGGCGCRVAEDGGGPAWSVALVGAAIALLRRRRDRA
jgi:MYXO-CTERM domain-containing protein